MDPFELAAQNVSTNVRTPVWVYAHPSMEHLAQQIVDNCLASVPDTPSASQGHDLQSWFVRERIQRRPEFKKTIKWDSFKDGFPNIFIENVKEMAGKDVIFLASFHSPAAIFEQISVIYAIPKYLAKSFTLILPYFPTGTMERVDTEGQVATAKTLASLLSGVPLCSRGPAQLMIFDIHALQERFYFGDNVIPRLETAVPVLKHTLSLLQETVVIAFPDDGAHKRFHSLFTGHDNVICHKIRNGDKRMVKVKEGDPTGHHVVIVDDLVQTGGTLIECAKALREMGALKVSAFVTHAVFPNESWRRFTNLEEPFEHFWITDSLPHARFIAQHPPFSLLSLSTVIADTLLGFDLRQV